MGDIRIGTAKMSGRNERTREMQRSDVGLHRTCLMWMSLNCLFCLPTSLWYGVVGNYDSFSSVDCPRLSC